MNGEDDASIYMQFPVVDTDIITGQLGHSRHASGIEVVSMYGERDEDGRHTKGFYMVRMPRGQVYIVDIQHKRAVASDDAEYEKYLERADEYIRRYYQELRQQNRDAHPPMT